MDRFAVEHAGLRMSRVLPFRSRRVPLPKDRERVVLLQGPVGPFFCRLQTYLEEQGCDAWRICFNAGDRFFSRRHKRIVFSGDLEDWERWFSDFVRAAQIDTVVLFGSARPIHRVARAIAADLGIQLVSLEEGYIRPGFVSVEQNGNNARSPLASKLPPPDFSRSEAGLGRVEHFRSFNRMSLYGALYYSIRTFFTVGKQKQLFHRTIIPHADIFYWLRNAWRRMTGPARNFSTVEQLLEHHDGRFFIVPLQVEADCQLQDASLGWNHLKLISATLKSFAEDAPADARLVFKVHPLERGHNNYGPLIQGTAEAYGILDRVDVVDIGSMGLLARHAAGMITINSTSGLSAIHHGTPLLVIGQALYAHPKLAVCARGVPDFKSFWTCRHVAPQAMRWSYLEWIRQEALVHGDYYCPRGIEEACQGIVAKLHTGVAHETKVIEARTAC